ncbi:protein HIDE1 isoform X1 [Ornithorhynchus anatinus]|uniref:protein HIDE1 isoform X1 n=1 Tax=Ornithorhynchus anatinus TaxID=9258 RepID=UPI0010A8C70C|nr:protein HIDE1 isoform X1 [Ornithorhynchus anatinus]XP_028908718.1 protein HIDE1 isoform X1 [Ornithorhynchus anatinus]XP_028908719.1 protein HIDE1 isoform X1 [Ornithorhynchus anatinus]
MAILRSSNSRITSESCEKMPWRILVLVAALGFLAIPAPSISLTSRAGDDGGDSISIQCVAPEGLKGATFILFKGEEAVQTVQAPETQPGINITLTNSSREALGQYRCQYVVIGEVGKQFSNLSEPGNITFTVPLWVLPVSLSLAGALILIVILVVVIVVIRRVRIAKLQKKRQRESCWTEANYSTTDMSFNNTLFSISMKMAPEDMDTTLESFTSSSTGPESLVPKKRPMSTSSPETPEFTTFRSSE